MDDEKIMEIAEQFLKPVGDHWCFENAIRDNGDIEDFANALLDAKDKRIAELESRVQQLEAERVSDEIINDYINIIKYGFGCRNLHKILRDEAQAILGLRQKNKEADNA